MTIDQIISELVREKQNGITSRFPCRAIMVKNIEQYRELLSKLNKIPDISVVSSGDLFSSADVMPRYENLKDSKYWDRWLILPGVSEYLRLFSKSEADSQRFAKLWSSQVPASSRGRIIIPLWGCEAQWHDKALHLCEDIRQEEFYADCVDENADEQQLDLVVLSGEFEQYIFQLSTQNGHMCIGLQEWYEYWADPLGIREDQILLTKRYASIQPTAGNITIRVIKDSFTFIRESLSGAHILSEENCPKQAQSLLFDLALHGGPLDKAILAALNVASFSGVDIMSKWNAMVLGEKQLVVLWLKQHQDDTYLCHCVLASSAISDILGHVLHDIFALYNSRPQWISESQKLIEAMGLERDEEYYKSLDQIPIYEERLEFLSGKAKNDRIYLLKLVGKWMREDATQVLSSLRLRQVYPELSAYLDHNVYDSDLGRYFSLYKSHKLENSLPDDEEMYFSGIQPEEYDYRFAAMSNMITDDCVILWIDALGAEWLPLLLWALKQNDNGQVKDVVVAQASLPTETCFNDQWTQMSVPHKKLDRLDKLAHKGVIDDPDYYTCVEDQLSFVSSLCKTVNDLLKEYHRVIITGDHGTSRLAARFFHKRDGANVPQGATVCSHGRYCQIADNTVVMHPNIVYAKDKAGVRYAVFSNYDHFTQSGFAAGADDENAIYGEVHGGATPEEMLVPVISFDSNKETPITAKWQSSSVKIMAKKAKATLVFNCPVSSVQVHIGAVDGICSSSSDKKVWSVLFQGIAPKTYSVSVAANGSLVQVAPLTIISALGGGDGDLP